MVEEDDCVFVNRSYLFSPLEYEVEYSKTKNTIIVKLFTDIIVDWVTSDAILFKWNCFTF